MMAKYRYPGSASFETSDKDIFFGRTQETAQFVDLLKVERLIVLYAKSGMGKTSLVNAGVIPELDRQGGFKHWRIRLQSYISQEKSIAPTLNLEKTLTQETTPDNAISRLTMPPQEQLWQYLRAMQYERQVRNEPLSMVLFFDQFEELFTYPAPQQQEFKETIAQLLRSEAPEALKKSAFSLTDSEQIAQLFAPLDIKLVFIIRADRMSLMDSMKDQLPYILHTTYEMKPLSRKQARQAIEEPAKKAGEFDSPPFRYDLKTLETILNYLSVSEQDKKPIPIESFQLQIICESAEQAILKQKGKESVQPEDLGDLDHIFEKYYYHKLSELNAKPAESLRIRKLIEEELVVEGRRLSLDTAFCQKRADQKLLERLVAQRLLREEPNSVGGLSYELSHDTLIDPIEKARKERQEIEREEARKKRIKRIASIIAVVFAGLSIIIASLSYLYVEAEKQKLIAQTNLNKANKLIDAFYFAYDRFALAFKSDNFYFIDKNGDKVEKLGEWDKAEQFSEYKNGFTKVWKDQKEYYLDTLGNSYRVAYKISDLSPEIKALDLTGTRLDSFPSEILTHKQLEVLILNETFCKSVPVEIAKLQNLKNLQLQACKLNNLPVQIWELKNLALLDLSDNKLTELPIQIGGARNLIWLNLNQNQLTKLPNQIWKLKNLALLDLSDNKLTELPAQIGELKNLIWLNLNQNQLTKLPNQIWELKNLTILGLMDNKLTKLPAQIGELKNLIWLILSENQLTKLPAQIGELKKLTHLYLHDNQLTSLPTQIGELKNLRELDLSSNELSSLPKQIEELKNLKYLYLQGNPFSEAEQEKIHKLLPNCEVEF